MKVRSHLPLSELERLERAEPDAAKSRRLRDRHSGHSRRFTAPAISMSVGLSRVSVSDGSHRYNESGLEGLDDRRGRELHNRRSRRNKSSRFGSGLKTGPRPEDQVCSLRGVDIQRILAHEFGVLAIAGWHLSTAASLGLFVWCAAPRHRHVASNPEGF